MFDLTYLSLGAGLQSSALAVMSALGIRDCPRADVAIFADTHVEPAWVYDQLETMEVFLRLHGMPLHVVSAGDLGEAITKKSSGGAGRFATIPVFTRGADGESAPLRRQCTREFKIRPIEKEVRRILDVSRVLRHKVRALVGISVDEISRLRPSRTPWVTNVFPLIDAGMTRHGCTNLLRAYRLPIPRKSACVFCPYHDDAYWHDLKTNWPEEWARAVAYDNAFRDMSSSGVKANVFLHRSLLPLDQVPLKAKTREETPGLWDNFTEECHGVCGV